MDRLEKKGKGIILMHDIQPGTAKAVPQLLAELKAKGYKVVHMRPKFEVKTLAEYDAAHREGREGPGADAGQRAADVERRAHHRGHAAGPAGRREGARGREEVIVRQRGIEKLPAQSGVLDSRHERPAATAHDSGRIPGLGRGPAGTLRALQRCGLCDVAGTRGTRGDQARRCKRPLSGHRQGEARLLDASRRHDGAGWTRTRRTSRTHWSIAAPSWPATRSRCPTPSLWSRCCRPAPATSMLQPSSPATSGCRASTTTSSSTRKSVSSSTTPGGDRDLMLDTPCAQGCAGVRSAGSEGCGRQALWRLEIDQGCREAVGTNDRCGRLACRGARFWFEETRPKSSGSRRTRASTRRCAAASWRCTRSLPDRPSETLFADARTALAAIIVLDQMSRNMFRDSPRAFATDAKAQEHCGRRRRQGASTVA